MKVSTLLFFSLLGILPIPAIAQSITQLGPSVPKTISYQGSIAVDSQPFTGTGYFKLLLFSANPLTENPTTATANVSERVNGVITEITLNDAGAGYLGTPFVSISGGGGSGAVAVAEYSSSTSEVTGVRIIDGGTGYTSTPTVSFSNPAPAEVGFWSNTSRSDSFGIPVSEPFLSFPLQVQNGLYSVELGGDLTGRLPPLIDFRPDLKLRVWFSVNENGPFQLLTPDQPISAVPFALIARRIVGPGAKGSGGYAMAWGIGAKSSSFQTTAIGPDTLASGRFAVAIGNDSTASGENSVAVGIGTVAASGGEMVVGQYNTEYTPISNSGRSSADRLFGIGNGSSSGFRSDALIVRKDGRSEFIASPPSTSGFFVTNYASLFRTKITNGGDVLAIKVPEIEPDIDTNFIAFFDGSSANNGSGDILGEIDGSGNGGVRFQSNGADYAEYLPPLDPSEVLQAGDVVAVRNGRITRDTSSFDQLMVISTNPIIIGNRPKDLPEDESGYYKVAFIGQVPVKVSGPVNSGDFLLASSRNDGTAIAKAATQIRASDRPFIVGRSWDTSAKSGEKIVNAAVGLDHSDALVAELQAMKRRLDAIEAVLARQQNSASGQTTLSSK